MEQLSISDIQEVEYFFRLDFGIYSRWSHPFKLKKIPPLIVQTAMIQLFLQDEEVKELKEQYWLTGFELCNL